MGKRWWTMEFRGSQIFGQPKSVDEWSVWWFHIFSSSNSKLTSYFDKYPWYFWDGLNLLKRWAGQDVGDLCGFHPKRKTGFIVTEVRFRFTWECRSHLDHFCHPDRLQNSQWAKREEPWLPAIERWLRGHGLCVGTSVSSVIEMSDESDESGFFRHESLMNRWIS